MSNESNSGIRHHEGMVHPVKNPIDTPGKPVYMEADCLDLPEEKRDELNFNLFPITELTKRLKEELQRLKEDNKYFSFYDKNNKRYINSVDEYISLDNKFFMSYLDTVEKFYKENRNSGKLNTFPITNRDIGVIDIIYNTSTSKRVLKRNKYTFYTRVKRFRNEEEKDYCETVTEVIREIMIKYYNILKYNIDINDQKAVNALMDTIKENYELHVNEANNMNYFKKMIRSFKKR